MLQGPEHPDSRAGSTCACARTASPFPFPLFFLPSPFLTRLGEWGTRGALTGLSQWADGPRAQPPPSLRRRPIEIYYNVVATRGGGARAGGRAGCRPGGPRLAEGRREGARRSLLLAHLLPPSAGGLVSQSACSRQARESQRAGASDASASFCLCSSDSCSGRRGTPVPGATGEARRLRRASCVAGRRGAELSPRGRSWRPRWRRSLFVSSPPQAPGRCLGLYGPRSPEVRGGWSRSAAGLGRKRRGLIWGRVSKLGLGLVFDAGKSVRSGPSFIAQWAGALEGHQTGENGGFRVVKVLGAAAECCLLPRWPAVWRSRAQPEGWRERREDLKAFPPQAAESLKKFANTEG